MSRLPILIAGAGPTGLNLALSLVSRNIPFRILSSAAGPGEHSRAMVVQARTLEFYDQLGFARDVVQQGVVVKTAHISGATTSSSAPEFAAFHFDDLGSGLSPFPFLLAYPQDDHERFLLSRLQAAGISVEWNTRLTGLRESDNRIYGAIQHHDGREEEVEAAYICGCDGAHSCVRQSLGLEFPGGTYSQRFYVADVKITRGFDRDGYFHLGEHLLALMLPVRLSGMQRLIGIVPPELSTREDLTFDDIRHQVEQLLGITVAEVNWFSTYRVHHRVADRFRVGRAFVLGDAAHIHSPAGGQGMNTGIGDAVNLGWKLAQVLQGRAPAALLDSYEPERIAFARSLVSTTDRVFTNVVAPGVVGEFIRRIAAPLTLAVASRINASRHLLFRTISQTRIHYPDSPLSEAQPVRCMEAIAFRGPVKEPTTSHPCAPLIGRLMSTGKPTLTCKPLALNRRFPCTSSPGTRKQRVRD
jgi:2-polyprenyl-6-methoxyphenol hydroxylase-like FAD-dependent oxidoreductase